jgi:pyruvate formate lyase activating enzyme
MQGLIFSVKRYSIHDGPGIRVTFFLKGCPLNCLWCHNPEGLSPLPETVIQKNKIGEREFCKKQEAGQYYSAGNVLDIIEKERVFINHSKGGVTFSGGEPMLQPEFLYDALKRCSESGYHTAVDTSGYSSAENFKLIIPYTDLFLFDLKHLDNLKHIEYTGVSNDVILDNYRMLNESGKDIFVRIPVIPGYNDDSDHLNRLKLFLSSPAIGSVRKICLLPYHKTGSSKYAKFHIPVHMENVDPPSRLRMQELKEFFSATGIKVKIGG